MTSKFQYTDPGSSIDLSSCDLEPIDIPSAIQPHGLLISVDPQLTIIQISANSDSFLGIAALELVGKSISSIIEPAQLLILRSYLSFEKLKTLVPLSLELKTRNEGPLRVSCTAHRYAGHIVLEFEPNSLTMSGPEVLLPAQLTSAIAALQSESAFDEVMQAATLSIKALTGYDRVLIYRFDKDWHGEVVAESKEDELEPLLGLHYPSSDIPVRARNLYKRNLIRMIADVDYNSVKLVPEQNSAIKGPLDMSDCSLRSVSTIHIEYLHNMGVRATMTISLMVNNELWGLIACHHYSPKYIPLAMRSTAELFGQLVALRILGFIASERFQAEAASAQAFDEIVTTGLKLEGDIAETFNRCSEQVSKIFAGSGSALISDDRMILYGELPDKATIRRIVKRIDGESASVFSTDCIARSFEADQLYETNRIFDTERSIETTNAELSGGLIAIRTSESPGEWILCFRPEQTKLVNWAGNPKNKITLSADGVRLHPRGSFKLWSEEVKGQSLPWSNSDLISAKVLREKFLELRHESAERQAANREMLRQHKEHLLLSLAHDLKNPIIGSLRALELIKKGAFGVNLVQMSEVLDELISAQNRLQQRVSSFLVTNKFNDSGANLVYEAVELKTLIESAVSLASMHARSEKIDIQTNLENDLFILGEADAISRVVENLVANAVKFSTPGTVVKVALERSNSYALISVLDSGPGIPASELPFLFKRFWQGQSGKHAPHGSGLGLYSCRQIIEMHNGEIWCESEPSQGAKFVIKLPFCTSDHKRTVHNPR